MSQSQNNPLEFNQQNSKKEKNSVNLKFYRLVGAIVIVLGLYLVVWGKSKDYDSPTPISKDTLPEKVNSDEGNAQEHSNHEVINITNFEAGIKTREQQV